MSDLASGSGEARVGSLISLAFSGPGSPKQDSSARLIEREIAAALDRRERNTPLQTPPRLNPKPHI
jgi:hypothetical protein